MTNNRPNITVVEGDLLDQDVEVIVNAWNRNIIPWWLLLPQGVSGAIKRRGGTAPFKEVGKHGAIPLGGAVLTSAGKLPFQGINVLMKRREGRYPARFTRLKPLHHLMIFGQSAKIRREFSSEGSGFRLVCLQLAQGVECARE